MMKRTLFYILAAVTVISVLFVFCSKEKVRVETQYLLYHDIYGNAEFEADGDYPPPDNLDNFDDGLITVTLRFGEDIAIYTRDEVYGYSITVDQNPENYKFPFVPNGYFWLEAEFTVLDSCFYDKTDSFYHSDTTDTEVQLRPTFLGLDKGCFSLILSGAAEDECVQVGERSWVTKKVYDSFYRDREEGNGTVAP
ncbi:MAG: hypothetical protein U9N45_07870 [Gemmatimonadota bacterium]|nr:hypothetical protein [Gemmatimonadota bacterium]